MTTLRRPLIFLLSIIASASASGQQKPGSPYVARCLRADSLPIVFNIERQKTKSGETWAIRNAEERIRVTDILRKGDSLFADMPVFESNFRLQEQKDGRLTGDWVKGTSADDVAQPVVFRPGTVRFPVTRGKAKADVNGRWKVTFTRADGSPRYAVAEFSQKGERLTGTFVTPSGDYRYLEGILSGDSMQLSCFDGSHAYYFGAKLEGKDRLVNGVFASGMRFLERWTAVRDAKAELDASVAATSMKPGEERLRFRFPDLDSNMVSIDDERFKGKVVVVQIMGSWCPNCMDETAFLSEYYRKNRDRGVEMVALAYEYSTDFPRASKSLEKFRKRFNVEYPMLITGVSSADEKRTEKTLPGLTPIRVFPTTLFIDRKGRVAKVHPGFAGQATGVHHEEYVREFEETVQRLLKAD